MHHSFVPFLDKDFNVQLKNLYVWFMNSRHGSFKCTWSAIVIILQVLPGVDLGGPGVRPPTPKNEAPAPKFYKIEALEWQFEAHI